MLTKNTIVLIGPPGVGKTSVGLLLAQKFSAEFIDTDSEIEKAEKRSIPEIFAADGETFFRTLEIEILDKLARSEQKIYRIVSAGGGLPVWGDNLARLKEIGTVFFLNASLDKLIHRLGDAKNRPLLTVNSSELGNRLKQIILSRTSIYKQAHHELNTDLLTAEDVANQILELVKFEK